MPVPLSEPVQPPGGQCHLHAMSNTYSVHNFASATGFYFVSKLMVKDLARTRSEYAAGKPSLCLLSHESVDGCYILGLRALSLLECMGLFDQSTCNSNGLVSMMP